MLRLNEQRVGVVVVADGIDIDLKFVDVDVIDRQEGQELIPIIENKFIFVTERNKYFFSERPEEID